MRIIVSDEVLKPAPVQGFGCLLAGLAAPRAAQTRRGSKVQPLPLAAMLGHRDQHRREAELSVLPRTSSATCRLGDSPGVHPFTPLRSVPWAQVRIGRGRWGEG